MLGKELYTKQSKPYSVNLHFFPFFTIFTSKKSGIFTGKIFHWLIYITIQMCWFFISISITYLVNRVSACAWFVVFSTLKINLAPGID